MAFSCLRHDFHILKAIDEMKTNYYMVKSRACHSHTWWVSIFRCKANTKVISPYNLNSNNSRVSTLPCCCFLLHSRQIARHLVGAFLSRLLEFAESFRDPRELRSSAGPRSSFVAAFIASAWSVYTSQYVHTTLSITYTHQKALSKVRDPHALDLIDSAY